MLDGSSRAAAAVLLPACHLATSFLSLAFLADSKNPMRAMGQDGLEMTAGMAGHNAVTPHAA